MSEQTTLQTVLEANKELISLNVKLVQFIYQNFGDNGLEELEQFSFDIGMGIQENQLGMNLQDGKVTFIEDQE